MSEKNKPLKDIRYYECSEIPSLRKTFPSSEATLLNIPKAAHRIGQRIARIFHSKSFSVGTYDHVYIAFTPTLPIGQIMPTDLGSEWWHRYTVCGISSNFNSFLNKEKLEFIQSSTFDVLCALQPNQKKLINDVRQQLNIYGSRLRIFRATKATKAYQFDVWFDVPDLGETSYLYITALDKSSGELKESPPFPLKDYEDVFPLISTISFSKGILSLNPRKSFRASLYIEEYQTPIQFRLSEFVSKQITAKSLKS